MAKVVSVVVAVFSIVAFATVVAHAHDSQLFKVEGDVFCDPCRIQFQTPLSKKLSGAAIRLECSNIDTKTITYSINGTTDGEGHYSLEVDGDHEDDICEVKVVTSPDSACDVSMADMATSRVVCAANSGINSDVRYANPIGFMTKEVAPQCASVMQELFSNDD